MATTSSNEHPKGWYQSKVLVHILLVVLFPVGLYALWKNTKIAKWWKIVATIIVAAVVLNIAAQNKAEKESVSNFGSSSQSSETSKKTIPLPADQEAFIKSVEGFYDIYDDAPNELKKSALRVQRRDAIQGIVGSRRVANWVGTIADMQTTSDGKASVEVRLGGARHILVKTWNNTISDLMSHTLIESGSSVYNALADLSEGDIVEFSGTFLSDKQDYIEEGSISERGSMTDPEFLFRFSDIHKK